jgi:hypothetical protein
MSSALSNVAARHEVLRTAIFPNLAISPNSHNARLVSFARTGLFEGGLYVQSVMPSTHVSLQELDATAVPESAMDRLLRGVRHEGISIPFDFNKPPLLRGSLVKINRSRSLLYVFIDDLMADDKSLSILANDIRSCYASDVQSHPDVTSLMPPISSVDYGLWEQKLYVRGFFAPHLRYWRDIWRTYGPYRPRPGEYRRRGASENNNHEPLAELFIPLNEEISKRIRECICSMGIDDGIFSLAVMCLMLCQSGKRDRAAVWWAMPNRDHAELDATIGPFCNPHLIGVDLNGVTTRIELFKRVARAIAQASEHQAMPLAYLWRALGSRPRATGLKVAVRSGSLPRSPEPLTVDSETLYYPRIARWFDLAVSLDGARLNSVIATYFRHTVSVSDAEQVLKDWLNTAHSLLVHPDQLQGVTIPTVVDNIEDEVSQYVAKNGKYGPLSGLGDWATVQDESS